MSVDRREFVRNIGVVTAGLVGGLPLLACGSNADAPRKLTPFEIQENVIKEKGLYGDLPLVDLRETQGYQSSGSIGGGILFLAGSYKGSTVEMVRFSWQTKGSTPTLVRSTLPETLVTFPATDQPTPTVELVFDYPYQYGSTSPMDSLNPSDFLDPDAPTNKGRVKLVVARLKLNDETYYNWTGIKRNSPIPQG